MAEPVCVAPDADGQLGAAAICGPDDGESISASAPPEHGRQPEFALISDEQIWPPLYLLAGAIVVSGGSLDTRRVALGHLRQMLVRSLDDFRVVSERTEPWAATLCFQTQSAGTHEDFVLEAIASACRSVSSPANQVVARVVSLRTQRQLTWRATQT